LHSSNRVTQITIAMMLLFISFFSIQNNKSNDSTSYDITLEEIEMEVPTEYQLEDNEYSNISMVLYSSSDHTYQVYNKSQAHNPLSPCSTFKIPHTLIGLDLGVLKKGQNPYEWSGEQYHVESWNRDHTLESAIKNSVVWYFQRVSSAIGPQRMQEALNNIGYGNANISGGQDDFWLKSSLKISAMDQVDFLEKLYNKDLPFTEEHQNYVKEMILLDRQDDKTLYGKTGGGENIGWFIGFIEDESKTTYFALNIIDHPNSSGLNAKELCINELENRGIY